MEPIRAIPATDYIDARQAHAEPIAPVPCFNCDYRAHCGREDQRCAAWRDYDGRNSTDGHWFPEDRIPDDIRLSRMLKDPPAESVTIAGTAFREGSACHKVYEAVGDLGISTIDEIRMAVRVSGATFTDRTISEAVQKLKRLGAIVRLAGAGWMQT